MYKSPGQESYSISQFNGIPSESGPEFSQIYSICSTEQPTLLDTYNWPTYYSIGGANGITSDGPNGSCETNFDCYTAQQ